MRALVLGLLALASCNGTKPIAQGPEQQITAATRAARSCGVVELRHDPLDEQNSMLLIGSRNTQVSVDCTMDWIRKNAPNIQVQVEKAS
ncbi:MAG TPA: hypothetical protein VN637_13690 [Roseiarcus sp.]|nr:hypothetical protein [Roseiarcus sp.]